MAACRFGNSGSKSCLFECSLQDGFMQMVSALLSCHPVRKMAGRRKYPLPAPLLTCVGIFSLQGIRQRHTAQSLLKVVIMLPLNSLKMSEKRLLYRRRKHGMSVFVSFGGANKY